MAARSKSEKMVVLVAEDEPSMLSLVASHMRGRGYDVIEASDGETALELAQKHAPRLVVLDVMMPGMSGWDVCKRIKNDKERLRGTLVLMLTGIGESLNDMTSPLFQADGWLDKPFHLKDLDAKIDALVGAASPQPVAAEPAKPKPAPKKAAAKAAPKKAAAKAAPKKAAAKPAAAPKPAAKVGSAPKAAPKATSKKAAPAKPAPKSASASKGAKVTAKKAAAPSKSKAGAKATSKKGSPKRTKA